MFLLAESSAQATVVRGERPTRGLSGWASAERGRDIFRDVSIIRGDRCRRGPTEGERRHTTRLSGTERARQERGYLTHSLFQTLTTTTDTRPLVEGPGLEATKHMVITQTVVVDRVNVLVS